MATGGPVQGVYAAIPTPFDERRELDDSSLAQLIDYLLERDLQGVALLTEAAEDAFLRPEERRQLIDLVSDRLGDAKPFLVSVSAASSAEAIELARHAEIKGATAVLLSPPRTPGVGYRELYRHVDRVARAVSVPIFLCDRPNGALDSLEPEELATLIGHIELGGVFAPHAQSDDLDHWRRLLGGDERSLLTGCSLALARDKTHGATGAICAISVLMPAQAAAVWQSVLDDTPQTGERQFAQAKPIVDLLGPPAVETGPEGLKKLATRLARRPLRSPQVPATFPAAMIKEGLHLQGHPIRVEVRPPFEKLKTEARERLKTTLRLGGALS